MKNKKKKEKVLIKIKRLVRIKKGKKKTGGKKGRRKWKKGWKVVVVLGLVGVLGMVVFLKDVPDPKKLSSGDYPESSRIFDRNGKLLYEFFSEKKRVSVKLDEVPEDLKKATLAIEDAKFYKHFGFDIRGIIRAIYRTVFKKRLEGGSTLTQQLVKNALLTPERTLTRKIKEAVLTLATEILYGKDEIFEMYLNQTPYGGTFWGVEVAARGYFNKNVSELSLAESALMAGLPGSPSRYSPFAHPEAAKTRQLLVLRRMVDEGYISEEEVKVAEEEELSYYVSKEGIRAAHFVFYAKERLIEEYSLDKVNEGGLDITTTLDWEIQDYVQGAVASEVAKLERYKVSNGAVVVTEPKTGQILAMVGSKDYFAIDIDGKVNVATSRRQPGSSIKPLNYAVGLEMGKITAAAVVYDGPTCFTVAGQKPYCPTNYGYNYYGLQTVRNSLANSLNMVAVKVLELNGVETFVASASAMGIKTFKESSDYGLSLTLGGGEVEMVDMAVAFGVLANGGVKQELTSIMKVTDRHGNELESYGYIPGERVVSRATAFLITDILSDDGARSMVFGRGSKLNIKGHAEVAVKTGTTNDMRDNWTIGYISDYVVVVWVGNNDNSKMSWIASGITGATPIWNKVMSKLVEDKKVKKMVMPSSMVKIPVCNLTGKLIPEGGCESHFEFFKSEYAPRERVGTKQNVLIDKDTGKMVAEGEEKPNVEWQEREAVWDITGKLICLDCPRDEVEKQ